MLFGFHSLHPEIFISINEKASHSIPDFMEEQGASFGFMTEIGSAAISGFEKRVICSDTMALCLPASHELCRYDIIDPQMLIEEKFAMPLNKGPML